MMELIKNIIKHDITFYFVLFITLILINFPFGFHYFAYSDDFNAYGTFALFHENIWQNVVLRYHLHTFRPLAGLADAYLITPFWRHGTEFHNQMPVGQNAMAFVLLFITTLRFVTILLLKWVFTQSGIIFNRTAIVFFSIFPALTEAAYWINASSRIVVSAFFAVAAVACLLKYINSYHYRRKNQSLPWLIFGVVLGIFAQGFYEQGIIFSFVLTLGILIIHREKIQNHLLFIIPFANTAIIGIYYFAMRNVGRLSERTTLAEGNIFANSWQIFTHIFRNLRHEQFPTIENTIRFGLHELLRSRSPSPLMLMIIVAIILAPLLVFTRHHQSERNRADDETENAMYTLIAAIILFFSTFAIFAIIAESWIWVRNFYFATIGLAMFIGLIDHLLDARFKYYKYVKLPIAFAAVLIFMAGYVLEVNSIRNTERRDGNIVRGIITHQQQLEIQPDETIWLFGVRWNQIERNPLIWDLHWSPQINPRITSEIMHDWQLNGMMAALSGEFERPWVVPVMNGAAIPMHRDRHFTDGILLGIDESGIVRHLELYNDRLVLYGQNQALGRVDVIDGVDRFFFVRQ